MAGNFLEQIKRAREAAGPAPEHGQAKPTEQMSDPELEEAITTARRDLLDAQHAELREREVSRVPGGSGDLAEPSRASGLAEVLGNLQRQKRRNWR
jgi:hypothetical protein